MGSTEDDFLLELHKSIVNVNYKRLEELLYFYIHAILYFNNVQPRIDAIISYQALQK